MPHKGSHDTSQVLPAPGTKNLCKKTNPQETAQQHHQRADFMHTNILMCRAVTFGPGYAINSCTWPLPVGILISSPADHSTWCFPDITHYYVPITELFCVSSSMFYMMQHSLLCDTPPGFYKTSTCKKIMFKRHATITGIRRSCQGDDVPCMMHPQTNTPTST
jgi:hypothetical protein